MIIKKLVSILDWAKTMSINLLGFLSAPIIYPILYPLRENPNIRTKKPFWYYFDDEDGDYGTDWFRESLKYGNKTDRWSLFRIAYKWLALRNPAWNLQTTLKPIEGEKILHETWGHVQRGDLELDPYVFANFKYVNKEGVFKNNIGDFLSIRHSAFGKRFTWYYVDDKLYWRLSYADNLVSKLWIEFHLGVSNDRYTFRLKFKWNLKLL